MTNRKYKYMLFVCILMFQNSMASDISGESLKEDSLQKLIASDHFGIGGDLSYFGYSVDVDDGLTVVGAPGAMGHGLALVYRFSDSQWELVDTLFPEDGKRGDEFGTSVSIKQGRIVVGAIEAQVDRELRSGAAYVYMPSGETDRWEQVQKLVASDFDSSDQFGAAIVQNEQEIIISAPRFNTNGERGQVYTFKLVESVWSEQQRIPGVDNFGEKLALNQNYLIASAHIASVDQINRAGRAYVYELIEGEWTFKQVLQASDPFENSFFGSSLDLDGDWLIVGADKGGRYFDGEGYGSVYVFKNDLNGWIETQKLQAPDDIHSNHFGTSVKIGNNRILVSSNSDETTSIYHGYVDEFELVEEQWIHANELGPFIGSNDDQFGFELSMAENELIVAAFGDDSIDPNAGSFFSFSGQDGIRQENIKVNMPAGSARNYFGTSLDIVGDRMLIGSYGDDTLGRESGSVYDFRLSEGQWTEHAKLSANNPSDFEYFGYAIAMDESRAVIGAPPFSNNEVVAAGSAYVFELEDGEWVFDAQLVPSNGQDDDFFGSSVAIHGDTILVGASGADDFGDRSGTAYVFQKVNNIWAELTDLQVLGQNEDDYLGIDVALNERWAFVAQLGSVHVFDRQTGWKAVQRIDGFERFGRSIDLDGNRLIVGSPDFNGGLAYIYHFNDVNWEQEQQLYPRGGVRDWGESVALSGENAVVGSGLASINGEFSAGSAHWFVRSENGWQELKKIYLNTASRYDSLGAAVSLYGEQVALGAPGANDYGTNSGAVYMFKATDLIYNNGFETK